MIDYKHFLKEIKYGLKITPDFRSFLKLLFYTIHYHLGNHLSFFQPEALRNINCRINCKKLTLELGNDHGSIITLYHVFGHEIYRFPFQRLGSVRTIIDLGAHIGLVTLYFASLFPDAQIFSVEPAPANFKLLKKNCEANEINAKLINKCIDSDKGFKKFYLSAESSVLHSLFERDSNHRSIDVETITMDALLEENRIEEVDILKVDIEGAEGKLFIKCVPWLTKIRFIIMEIHPELVNSDECIRTIISNGFRYHPEFSAYSSVFIREDQESI